MSLNFQEGTPIARIITGTFKNKIIYISTEDKSDDTDFLGTKKIDLKKDSLEPILNPDERTVTYIAGPAGSGKSTIAAQLIGVFKKLHPKSNVYFFSRTDYKDDPAYAHLKLKQITLDDSLVTEPIDITEIENQAMVVFDDTNTIIDKHIKEAVEALIADILEVGRKLNLSIIITSHLINSGGKLTRTILNELQSLIVYPSSGSAYQIRYVLKQYFGLDHKQIDTILKLPSRWVMIRKNYPTTIVYSHGVYIL